MINNPNRRQIYPVNLEDRKRKTLISLLNKKRLRKEEKLFCNLTEINDWKYLLFPEEIIKLKKLLNYKH